MADKSATLKVTIVGDSKSGQQAFSDTANAAEHAGKRLGGVGTIIKGALGAEVVTKIGEKIADFASESVNKFQEVGSSTLKMQRVMGGTAEDVSRLGFAAGHSGLDTDNFAKSMGKLEKFLVSGTKASKGLAKEFQDTHGKLKPMAEVLPELSEKFAKMPNGAEKSALAMKLFGKSGIDMLPFLNKGKDGIKELMDESDKLGTTLSGSDLDALKENTKAKRAWNGAIEGLQIQLGKYLYPAMTAVTLAMVKIIPIVKTVLTPIFAAIGAVMRNVVVPAIKFTIDHLSQLVTAVLKTGVIQNAVSDIVKAFTWLTDEGKKLLSMFTGFATGALPQASGALSKVKAVISDVRDHVEAFARVAMPAIINAFHIVAPIVESFAKGVLSVLVYAFQNLMDILKGVANDFTTWVLPAIRWIADEILTLAKTVLPYLVKAFQSLMTFLRPIIAQIPALFKDMVDIVRGIFTVLYNVVKVAVIAVGAVVYAAVQVLIFLWKHFGSIIIDYLKATWQNLQTIFKGGFSVVKGLLDFFSGLFTGNWSKMWHGIVEILKGIWGILTGVLSQALNLVQTVWRLGLSALSQLWSRIWHDMKETFSGILQWILYGVADLMKATAGMLRALGHVPGFGWATDAANKIDGAARSVDGFARGLNRVPNHIPVTIGVSANVSAMAAKLLNAAPGSNAAAKANILFGRASGGTDIGQGLSWVGENGPELAYLPSGTSVLTAPESKAVANGTMKLPSKMQPKSKAAAPHKAAAKPKPKAKTTGQSSAHPGTHPASHSHTKPKAKSKSKSKAHSTHHTTAKKHSGGSAHASGITINVDVKGHVMTDKQLATVLLTPIRNELIAFGKRNGGHVFPPPMG